MPSEADAIARAVDSIAARFEGAFTARARLSSDRALAGDLTQELQPVAHALVETLRASGGAPAFSAREAIALVNLWGRRAAVLQVTPSGAIDALRSLLAAIEPVGIVAEALRRSLEEVFFEGYVAAREERLEALAGARAAHAIPIVELVRGGFFVAPAGLQEAHALDEVFDELGRRMLDRDARACVIHASALQGADRERAGALFGVQANCTMLGVRCIFSGISPIWSSAATERGVPVHELEVVEDLAAALRLLFAECGLELRPHARLARMLERWVPRRR